MSPTMQERPVGLIGGADLDPPYGTFTMRIGIFGGTFDPVHMGHLILAEQCRTQAALDQVWFMPSAHPPHKAGLGVTRFEQRCEMIELAIAGHTSFRVERLE